jgi:S1-C subfamily serine protease
MNKTYSTETKKPVIFPAAFGGEKLYTVGAPLESALNSGITHGVISSHNRPWQYNATTSILGLGYHDLFGGNDKMKVNATWQSNR